MINGYHQRSSSSSTDRETQNSLQLWPFKHTSDGSKPVVLLSERSDHPTQTPPRIEQDFNRRQNKRLFTTSELSVGLSGTEHLLSVNSVRYIATRTIGSGEATAKRAFSSDTKLSVLQ